MLVLVLELTVYWSALHTASYHGIPSPDEHACLLTCILILTQSAMHNAVYKACMHAQVCASLDDHLPVCQGRQTGEDH